jgi:hypothetical protein
MIFNKKQKKYIVKDGIEIAPGIFVYDKVIDNSEKLIELSYSYPEKWVDSSMGSGSHQVVNKKIRNTRILHISQVFQDNKVWFETSKIIWTYANKYGSENNVPFSNMEHLQLLHYSTEEGFYKPHVDTGPGMERIFSAIIYLNDVDEGGETYFNNFKISIPPKAGRLAIFPASYTYKHEAKTPKSNDKFALVTWFNPSNNSTIGKGCSCGNKHL